MGMASSELLSISDSSYPHLVLVKDAKLTPVQWHRQEMFFRLVHSSAVRISARGVRFVPQSHHVVLPSTMWQSSACIMDTTQCLCSIKKGAVRFLPSFPLPVYMQPPFFLGEAERMAGPNCKEGITGRVVSVETAANASAYDISLCNVLSPGAEYVFVPLLGELHLLVDPISNVVLFLLSMLVVYLMVRLGQNLQTIMLAAENNFSASEGMRRRSTFWTVAAMFLTATICCFCTSSSYVLEGFITLEDRVIFLAMICHIVYYCVRVSVNFWFGDRRRANPINPMITSISLAVQRVYGTLDNPYSLMLFFILLTWILHKISMLGHSVVKRNGGDLFKMKWRLLDIIVDCGMVCTMIYAGVFVALHEELFKGTFVLQGVLAAMTLNRGILPFHILYSVHRTPSPI
jgi:hypothetical protein